MNKHDFNNALMIIRLITLKLQKGMVLNEKDHKALDNALAIINK